jgi:two-component system nitrogen regulation sensor histidine kinase NtrY
MIELVLLDLVFALVGILLLARKILVKVFKNYKTSRLRTRIILIFSTIAAIPTIIVSCFSVFFFNFGIQAWFDEKVATVLNQSVKIADAYVYEHKLQLRDTALNLSAHLGSMYYDLLHNHELFHKVLNMEADSRLLSEAIVFQRSTNTVLAQSSMSFSLSFTRIPAELLDRADRGEVVEMQNDISKIRIIVKLGHYHDAYMIVGRVIDKKIIQYIAQTHAAKEKYNTLRTDIRNLEVKFSLVFFVISVALVFLTIIIGVIFANYIVKPIKRLLHATEVVQSGDLSVQIKTNTVEDELTLLTHGFNRMVKKLYRQQKDLTIAQRAIAWSDVARRVAHEIKNPLTPITLSAERILKKFAAEVSDREMFERYVNTILRHTRDIHKIVSNFTDFAKMPLPSFEKVNLIYMISEFVEARKMLSDSIVYSFISDVEMLDFICDKTQINQVMVNLCKNSEESLELVVHKKEICVKIATLNDTVEIIVSDNGRGFSQGLIEKATEPYMTTRTKGTGLGLAIVKKIVEDHAGEMEISNIQTGGAEIKLIFHQGELIDKMKI